jgi:predicted nucleotide-binding protein (sugar kinase/HSP70/actin superfamily)
MNDVSTRHWRPRRPAPLRAADARRAEFLFGGLHWRAERLVEAAFASEGLRARALPTATRQDLMTGRELADIGQCCPTSFTTGNLANFLRGEAERIGADAVRDRYVFLSVGSCGACRFGQYHQSYELALRNLGLEGVRMLLLAQDRVDQAAGADDFQLPLSLVLGALWGVLCAEVVQGLEYRTRPYEVVPGATDRAVRESIDLLAEAFRNRPRRGRKWGSLLWHLTTPHFVDALRQARARFDTVEVDRLRPRPVVMITGEFYLHTVEGEPNYNMHRWLEAEGAEVLPASVAVWIDYLIRFAIQEAEDRRATLPRAGLRIAAARGLQRLLRLTFDRMRHAMNDIPHAMPQQEEIRRLAAPYFHHRMSGGEGDMLIGKAIWAHLHRHAHMVCELSPYACMPNTMSIGAMARVLGDHPDMLYAPIEVKGDAEVHALSRCQMILTEAKRRAAAEFDQALSESGMTLDEARARVAQDPALRRATWRVPHLGRAGTGANLLLHLAGRRGHLAGRREAA